MESIIKTNCNNNRIESERIAAGVTDVLINVLRKRERAGCVAFEPQREISNNMVCATIKASDQLAHTHSLIRAFANRLNIL